LYIPSDEKLNFSLGEAPKLYPPGADFSEGVPRSSDLRSSTTLNADENKLDFGIGASL
jgi:hypothetical protein